MKPIIRATTTAGLSETKIKAFEDEGYNVVVVNPGAGFDVIFPPESITSSVYGTYVDNK